jgi:hypothetical protein
MVGVDEREIAGSRLAGREPRIERVAGRRQRQIDLVRDASLRPRARSATP